MTLTLGNALNMLKDDVLLSDGAQDWDATNLLDSLTEEELDREVGWNGPDLCFVGEDGYLKTPGAYRIVERETAAAA